MEKIKDGIQEMIGLVFMGEADEAEMTFTFKDVPFKITVTKDTGAVGENHDQ